MPLDKFDGLELPAAADMHVHLRDGAMMETVTPTIRQGGVNTVYVMPNLVPPITTVEAALAYRTRLQALAPDVTFLMSLYLHPSITPETIVAAKQAGITGVKSYPAGVTTNSAAGVVDYAAFYPVFAEMERQDLLLNLHGELPPSAAGEHDDDAVTVLNAEERFLPTLKELHARFPRLRIVLEHCTSKAAVEAVRSCGDSVAATITAHHLYLTVDDVVGNAFHFCKPVAKMPADRIALLQAAVRGEGKFFFGTDSAPHPVQKKVGEGPAAAGVFTQPYAVQLVLDALEGAVAKGWLREGDIKAEAVEGFLSAFGRRFYKVGDERGEMIVLKRKGEKVVDTVKHEKGKVEVVPFRRGQETWSVEWK